MFELRDYQQEAVDSINKYFLDGKGLNPVLVEPTGAGKSIIIAAYIKQLAEQWPSIRIVVLTHVKELLVQNCHKLEAMMLLADTGYYSAGLGMKHHDAQFLFAGIASIFRHAKRIGHVDLLIVDECHMINPRCAGMYRRFIDDLRSRNPRMPVVGFTATPFRMGTGYIYTGKDALFDGVAHETPIELLIDRGYLVPPICKANKIHADLSAVTTNSFGEFKESEMAEAFSEIMVEACTDMIAKSDGRACRLVFCSGRKHARDVISCLQSLGEPSVEYLDGETEKGIRQDLLKRVVAGEVKWVVNIGVLTTGFDAPVVDCVVMLRATESVSLYVQIIGRGLRILEGKADCLVLDYGRNVERHGALNGLEIDDNDGEEKTEVCPFCDSIIKRGSFDCPDCKSALLRDCPSCEKQYPRVFGLTCSLCGYSQGELGDGELSDGNAPDHEEVASEIDLIDKGEPKDYKVWLPIVDHRVSMHNGRGDKPNTMRVVYYVEGVADSVSVWVSFDSQNRWAKGEATKWAMKSGMNLSWQEASELTVDKAVELLWRTPFEIQVERKPKQYDKLLDYKW